jgi:hypothetical protein
MKKLFTTLFIVAGIYTASNAQTKGQTAFGVGVGVNGAYITDNADYSSGTSMRLDFNASLQAEYYVSDDFSLKLKGIYDRKGYGGGTYIDAVKGQNAINVNYYLNYVTVPLLITFHPGTEKLWYFNAGPYVGFLMSEKDSYTNASNKSAYNSTDFGADLGLGIQFPLSYKNQKTKFFVEYGWQLGFSNIIANPEDDHSANNVRQALGVGIRF